jgi:peroxiredoxin
MMSHLRLIRVAGAVLAMGAMPIEVGVVVSQTVANPPPVAQAGRTIETSASGSSKVDPARKGKEQGTEILVRAVSRSGKNEDDRLTGLFAINPKTAEWRPIYKGFLFGEGQVSPDGRDIVYSSRSSDSGDVTGIWVYDMKGEKAPRRIFERNGEPRWTNHGQSVVIGSPVDREWQKFETWQVNVDGSGRVKLPIPDNDLVLDCSQDGTWLATRTMGGDARHRGRLTVRHANGTGARFLTEGSADGQVFSIFKIAPDNRHVAYTEITTVDNVRHAQLFIVDIDGQRRRRVPTKFEPGATVVPFWSPDGSRLALNSLGTEANEGSITLVEFDGPNIRFRKVPLPSGRLDVQVFDWRPLAQGFKVEPADEPLDLTAPRTRYQMLLQEIKREKPGRPARYLKRFLEIADSAPDDTAAVDALIWMITFGFDGIEFSQAIDRLAQNYADRRDVGEAALTLGQSVSTSAEKLLRAVVEKSPHETVRGSACLALGRYFKHQAERALTIREDPESVKRWETKFVDEGAGNEYFVRFINRDPEALMKEAESVFERTIKEFGAETFPRVNSLRKDAVAELDEIRNLCAGKPAPEIVGQDIDGKPFQLSDFKGRVVVVSFWATSCASCREMEANERSLVKRMEGKPFALLGVNGDGDKDKLREWMKKEAITWRTWCDGRVSANTPGPISRQYNVSVWPTLYILDHRGVIRYKFLGSPGIAKLDAAVSALVEGVENNRTAK